MENSQDNTTGREAFPFILYAMLEEVEAKGNSHIISWQPHGKCFVVTRRKAFVSQIMPIYFRMTKFASFQRQLNLYGFRRITSGHDKGGHYHEHFLRGRRDLCDNILRRQIKGTRYRKPDDSASEPNFYQTDLEMKLPPSSMLPPFMPSNTIMPSVAVNSQSSVPSALVAPWNSPYFMQATIASRDSSLQQQYIESGLPVSMGYPNVGTTEAALRVAGNVRPEGFSLDQSMLLRHPSDELPTLITSTFNYSSLRYRDETSAHPSAFAPSSAVAGSSELDAFRVSSNEQYTKNVVHSLNQIGYGNPQANRNNQTLQDYALSLEYGIGSTNTQTGAYCCRRSSSSSGSLAKM